jgi:hypothetical protein
MEKKIVAITRLILTGNDRDEMVEFLDVVWNNTLVNDDRNFIAGFIFTLERDYLSETRSYDFEPAEWAMLVDIITNALDIYKLEAPRSIQKLLFS